MRKQEWVDKIMANVENERLEKIQKLESGCEYYITAGKCNGKNGNCQSCPITIARRTLLGRIPKETKKCAPTPKTTVMIKVGNITMNWKEVK